MDIGTVVEFILARRNIPRLNLIGWSWGTVTMSTYTTQNPGKVERNPHARRKWRMTLRRTRSYSTRPDGSGGRRHSCRLDPARLAPIDYIAARGYDVYLFDL